MKDSKGEPKTHREIAAEVMQRNEADIDFDKVNPMAIAMGARLNEAFDKTLSDSVLKTEIIALRKAGKSGLLLIYFNYDKQYI